MSWTPRLLRVGAYNPCNLTAPDRADLISDELSKMDIMGLIGTGRRHWGQACDYTPLVWERLNHWEVVYPWQRSALVNRSCGGSIFLRKKRFARPRAVKQFTPPDTIRGRIGCFILSGSLRVAPGFIYLPPHPLRARDKPDYLRTLRLIFDFLLEIIAALPTGTMPMFFVTLIREWA